MLELVAPTTTLHAAVVAAHREWGPGLHEDGFGLAASDEIDSPNGFSDWVSRLERASLPGAESSLRCMCRWIVEHGAVLGGIALRYGDDDLVEKIGHIGFGVRPSARRRGVATWALGELLRVARTVDVDGVLIVCEADNVGSARTIERNGGELEAIVDTDHGRFRRYRISANGTLPRDVGPDLL